MKKHLFFYLFSINIFFYLDAQANEWNAIIQKKWTGSKTNNYISIIDFTKNKTYQFTYTPSTLPFGAVEVETKLSLKRELFLSKWAHGARTIIIRVFEPKVSRSPICEIISEDEDVQTRFIQNRLEIYSAIENSSGIIEYNWIPCQK